MRRKARGDGGAGVDRQELLAAPLAVHDHPEAAQRQHVGLRTHVTMVKWIRGGKTSDCCFIASPSKLLNRILEASERQQAWHWATPTVFSAKSTTQGKARHAGSSARVVHCGGAHLVLHNMVYDWHDLRTCSRPVCLHCVGGPGDSVSADTARRLIAKAPQRRSQGMRTSRCKPLRWLKADVSSV